MVRSLFIANSFIHNSFVSDQKLVAKDCMRHDALAYRDYVFAYSYPKTGEGARVTYVNVTVTQVGATQHLENHLLFLVHFSGWQFG